MVKKKVFIVGLVAFIVLAAFICGFFLGRNREHKNMVPELISLRSELQSALGTAQLQGAAIYELKKALRQRNDIILEREAIITDLMVSESESGDLLVESSEINRDNLKGMRAYLEAAGVDADWLDNPRNSGGD